jgi:hypothetical protein
MQNGRMYELFDTYDKLDVSIAIKKESDAEKADPAPASVDCGVIPLPWHTNVSLKDIHRDPGSPCSFDDVLPPCVKVRKLRARWERIEGVGLRCTWVEAPEAESDAEPDPGHGAK